MPKKNQTSLPNTSENLVGDGSSSISVPEDNAQALVTDPTEVSSICDLIPGEIVLINNALYARFIGLRNVIDNKTHKTRMHCCFLKDDESHNTYHLDLDDRYQALSIRDILRDLKKKLHKLKKLEPNAIFDNEISHFEEDYDKNVVPVLTIISMKEMSQYYDQVKDLKSKLEIFLKEKENLKDSLSRNFHDQIFILNTGLKTVLDMMNDFARTKTDIKLLENHHREIAQAYKEFYNTCPCINRYDNTNLDPCVSTQIISSIVIGHSLKELNDSKLQVTALNKLLEGKIKEFEDIKKRGNENHRYIMDENRKLHKILQTAEASSNPSACRKDLDSFINSLDPIHINKIFATPLNNITPLEFITNCNRVRNKKNKPEFDRSIINRLLEYGAFVLSADKQIAIFKNVMASIDIAPIEVQIPNETLEIFASGMVDLPGTRARLITAIINGLTDFNSELLSLADFIRKEDSVKQEKGNLTRLANLKKIARAPHTINAINKNAAITAVNKNEKVFAAIQALHHFDSSPDSAKKSLFSYSVENLKNIKEGLLAGRTQILCEIMSYQACKLNSITSELRSMLSSMPELEINLQNRIRQLKKELSYVQAQVKQPISDGKMEVEENTEQKQIHLQIPELTIDPTIAQNLYIEKLRMLISSLDKLYPQISEVVKETTVVKQKYDRVNGHAKRLHDAITTAENTPNNMSPTLNLIAWFNKNASKELSAVIHMPDNQGRTPLMRVANSPNFSMKAIHLLVINGASKKHHVTWENFAGAFNYYLQALETSKEEHNNFLKTLKSLANDLVDEHEKAYAIQIIERILPILARINAVLSFTNMTYLDNPYLQISSYANIHNLDAVILKDLEVIDKDKLSPELLAESIERTRAQLEDVALTPILADYETKVKEMVEAANQENKLAIGEHAKLKDKILKIDEDIAAYKSKPLASNFAKLYGEISDVNLTMAHKLQLLQKQKQTLLDEASKKQALQLNQEQAQREKLEKETISKQEKQRSVQALKELDAAIKSYNKQLIKTHEALNQCQFDKLKDSHQKFIIADICQLHEELNLKFSTKAPWAEIKFTPNSKQKDVQALQTFTQKLIDHEQKLALAISALEQEIAIEVKNEHTKRENEATKVQEEKLQKRMCKLALLLVRIETLKEKITTTPDLHKYSTETQDLVNKALPELDDLVKRSNEALSLEVGISDGLIAKAQKIESLIIAAEQSQQSLTTILDVINSDAQKHADLIQKISINTKIIDSLLDKIDELEGRLPSERDQLNEQNLQSKSLIQLELLNQQLLGSKTSYEELLVSLKKEQQRKLEEEQKVQQAAAEEQRRIQQVAEEQRKKQLLAAQEAEKQFVAEQRRVEEEKEKNRKLDNQISTLTQDIKIQLNLLQQEDDFGKKYFEGRLTDYLNVIAEGKLTSIIQKIALMAKLERLQSDITIKVNVSETAVISGGRDNEQAPRQLNETNIEQALTKSIDTPVAIRPEKVEEKIQTNVAIKQQEQSQEKGTESIAEVKRISVNEVRAKAKVTIPVKEEIKGCNQKTISEVQSQSNMPAPVNKDAHKKQVPVKVKNAQATQISPELSSVTMIKSKQISINQEPAFEENKTQPKREQQFDYMLTVNLNKIREDYIKALVNISNILNHNLNDLKRSKCFINANEEEALKVLQTNLKSLITTLGTKVNVANQDDFNKKLIDYQNRFKVIKDEAGKKINKPGIFLRFRRFILSLKNKILGNENAYSSPAELILALSKLNDKFFADLNHQKTQDPMPTSTATVRKQLVHEDDQRKKEVIPSLIKENQMQAKETSELKPNTKSLATKLLALNNAIQLLQPTIKETKELRKEINRDIKKLANDLNCQNLYELKINKILQTQKEVASLESRANDLIKSIEMYNDTLRNKKSMPKPNENPDQNYINFLNS